MSKKLSILIILALLGLLAWLVSYYLAEKSIDSAAFALATQTESGLPPSDETPALEPEITEAPDGRRLYRHSVPAFRLALPQGFNITNFPQDDGEAIILQEADGDRSVQIFVSEYEGAPAGPTEIRADVQNLVMEWVQAIETDGVRNGAIFESRDLGDNKTHEAWFSHGGYLYQITAFPESRDIFAEIIGGLELPR